MKIQDIWCPGAGLVRMRDSDTHPGHPGKSRMGGNADEYKTLEDQLLVYNFQL